MNKYVERLYNGIIKENPTFVLMLGMCPTLAVTSSAVNGLGMGLSDRKSTRLNSSHANNSYAVFCLKKKPKIYFCDTGLA